MEPERKILVDIILTCFQGGFMSSSRKKASLVAIKNLYKLILVLNQFKKRVRSYVFILDVAFILHKRGIKNMINVVSKINGVNNVKSIDSIKPEGIVLNPSVLNRIKEYVDGNTDTKRELAKPKKRNDKNTVLDSRLDTLIDELAKTFGDITSEIKQYINEEIKNAVTDIKADNIKKHNVNKTRKNVFLTKNIRDEIWKMYLDGHTNDEIGKKYNIKNNRVSGTISSYFNYRKPDTGASDEDMARYILLTAIIKEINRRGHTCVIRDLKYYCERRHYVKKMPWKKAIVSPVDYIKTDKWLTGLFNEVLDDFKKVDAYRANEANVDKL